MAIDNQFGKGIGVAAGFDLGAQKPLDARVAVNTRAERDAHVENNRAYEGMLVYVAEDNMTYQLVKGEEEGQLVWKEFGFSQNDFNAAFNEAIVEAEERIEALEKLVVGGEGEGIEAILGDVADNKAAIEKLNGADNEDGSVAKAVKDAVDAEKLARENADNGLDERLQAVEGQLAEGGAIEARVAQNEADLEMIMGEGEGSIKKAVADLVDGAPQDLDTLKELSAALRDNKDVLTAIEEAFDDKLKAVQDDVDQNEADCDAAIASEKERAEKKEGELAQAIIDAIAQEVIDRNKAISDESVLRVAEEQRIEKECDDAMAQEVLDRNAAIKVVADELDKQKDAAQEGTLAKQIADEKARAEEAEGDLQDAIDLINGQLGNGGAIETRIAQAESDIVGLQGLVGQPAQAGEGEGEEGIPATGLHLALDNAKAELDQAILDEKDRAEGQEAAIRQELADEAAEIRGEMAAELGNYTVEAAEGVEAKEASGLRKEIEDAHKAMDQAIEDAVATEKGRAESAEGDLQDAIDALKDFVGEKAYRDEELGTEKPATGLVKDVADNTAAIAAQSAVNETQNTRLADLESFMESMDDESAGLAGRIEDLEKANEVGGAVANAIAEAKKAGDDAQADVDAVELRVDALEAKVGHDVDGDQPATGLFLEVDQAKAAADAAQADVDAVEGRVDALEAFEEAHDHSVMEQGIADNAAAIEAEVKEGGARDAAIAKALEAYSTTEEVKTILGNVVATLNLSMVDDKVVLKLGGAEGIALSEVSLDMVTDDEIDAIIDGLDEEAGE